MMTDELNYFSDLRIGELYESTGDRRIYECVGFKTNGFPILEETETGHINIVTNVIGWSHVPRKVTNYFNIACDRGDRVWYSYEHAHEAENMAKASHKNFIAIAVPIEVDEY